MKIIKTLLIFLFSTFATAQNLTISSSGQTGTSGTNWSIIGNVLYIGNSGDASINPSVISNHLSNTGDLTINLPWQSGVARNTYINNSITFWGSSTRTLTFNSANDIVFANATGITSSSASLNIVLRTATGPALGTPDNGYVKMDGINIDTKGGHFWVGGGGVNATWNGFTVGNSVARTWSDDIAGISLVGSSVATNGGNIYMNAQSFDTTDDDGNNYGINIENSIVSSGAGSIYLAGGVYGRYTNGLGMRVQGTTVTSITSTTGAIYIYGYGSDSSTNGNSWRNATIINGNTSVKSVSGSISIVGEAAFTATINDKEGINIGSGTAICSQTGNISLRGTNTLESSGQYSNSIRFAADTANSIRVGYDGTNAYSGNILIEGNSIYQRNTNAGAGSIAMQTTGTLTIQPTGNAFTYMRASDAGTLTFDNDWNFGTNLGGFVYGKTTNTTALTYSNALATSGPITIYAGTLAQNGAVSSSGAITFNCADFTLGNGINVSTSTASDITINATGNFTTDGTTRRTISSINGNIIIHADKEAGGSGTASIDYLTINPGSGNIIIRFETVDWLFGSGQEPYLNGTGSITIEPSDAAFPYGISTAWFNFDQDNNGFRGLTLGKIGNNQDITHTGSAITVAGPVNMYGKNITINSALSSSTAATIGLYATGDITQSSAISSSGGSVILWSDTDATSGGRIGLTSNITTNGGHIYAGGGSASETLNGLSIPSGYATSGTNTLSGITITGSTINSGGGSIRMKGTNNSVDGTNAGLIVSSNSTISSGAGALALYGQRTGNPSQSAGLFLGTEMSSGTATGNVTLSSTSGNIYLEGTTASVSNTYTWCHGLAIVGYGGDDVSIASTTGNISIYGDASNAATYAGEAVGFVIQSGSTTSLTNIATDGGSILINGKSSNAGSDFGSSYRAANTAGNISIGDSNTGNITLQFGSLSGNSNVGSVAFQSAGAYVFEGNSGASFGAAIEIPVSYSLGSAGTSLRIGSTNNSQDVTISTALSLNGPISVYGSNIIAQQNLTSTLAAADILLQATGRVELSASRTIQTSNGDITFRANSGGTPVILPNSTTGAITLNSGSSLLSTGGTITLGGNYDGTKGIGLYAASARVSGAPGILISNATLDAAGGNINIYGSCSTSYDDGIRLQANISTTGVGNIGIYGDAFGGLLAATNNVFFGGITFITAASIIETDAGNINMEAKLTNTQSNGTYALNFYRTAYSSGTQNRHIQLLSKSGNIQVTGDRGSTAAGGMGSSSWGDIYAGSPLSASWTASGNITFSYSSFVGAGLNGIIAKTTGGVTYEPVSTSFAAAQTFPYNANYILADGASSLTIGKSGNTADITIDAAQTIAGPISTYGGLVTLNANLTSTLESSKILIRATEQINTASSLSFQTNKGDFILWSDSDANSGGRIWLGDNNVINTINGSTVSGLSNGGRIVLAGGLDNGANGGTTNDGIPDGFASNPSSIGVYLGETTSNYTQMYSGGGDIIVRGASSLASATNSGTGLWSNGRWLANAGKGAIFMNGTSTNFFAVNFSNPASNVSTGNKHIEFISDKASGTAISIMGTSSASYGVVFNYENPKEVRATGGGAIVVNGTGGGSVPGIFIQNTDILATSGDITFNGGTNGIRVASSGTRLGSKASSAITSSSSTIKWIANSLDLYGLTTGFTNNFNTTGTATIEPFGTSFSSTLTFPNTITVASTVSGLTLGKAGNLGNITIGSALSLNAPIAIYGGTVALNGAITATNNDLTIEANTALTQNASGAITAKGLALSGAGTCTLNNTNNAIETIAGGTATNRLGSLSFTDASGGLTIGTIGSLSGIYTNTGVVSVETLTGNINLNESVSTNNTTATALTINAGKNSAIGVSSGGDIQVSGTPAITTGLGGIAKLFSGFESNSLGLTSLVGGVNNARYNYDETMTTFAPVLAVNTDYAIYRASLGTGDLTIVSSGGDAINSTWKYENGVISTTTSPVNINASILQDYLSTGALTIEAGNVTISGAITSTANSAFVINSNGTKTTTVNAAVSLGGAITFNSNDFTLGNGINISTSSASDITINANGNFATTSTTRRTISSANGTVIIHADKDANGTGQLDLDYLTFNPGTGATIIRGETVSFASGATAGPYINGTGSFTFEPSDLSFGEVIYTSWFEIDKDNNGISALTLGKIGNSSNIEQNTNFTIAGSIKYYGGYVKINGTLTSSANGDILLKGIADANLCVYIITGGITKSSGTGTLTMQGNGRVINSGTITTSGTGILNVVMWSDFDGDNVGGGTSQLGTISTNSGHVWLGGSNSNEGSYSWNGLEVGDGPSVGASGANPNALDIEGHITTSGGDLLVWAGNGSGGTNGIVTNAGWQLNVSNGDVVFITPSVLGAGPSLLLRQNGGTFTLVPNGTSFPVALNWRPEDAVYSGMVNWNFPDEFNYLWIENPATLTNLSIGRYDGMTSDGVPVVFLNTGNINFNLPTTIAGSMSFYGSALALNSNLTTTNATTGNISLSGTTISGTGNIALAAGRTATLKVSATSTYDGVVSGTGSALTKSGSGKLMLTKDQTYSGATTITAGDLQVGTGGSVSQASSGTISSTTAVAVASGSKLILTPNENIVFAASISGAGGVEIKGASGRYLNTWLTGTPTLFATNTTVLEALTRITGGLMDGAAITGSAACGAYQKSYSAATNTATLQLQVYNGANPTYYTKCVFVKLSQSGSNVMIQANTSIYSSGAGYKSGNFLGTNIATGGTSMPLVTSAAGAGYGISEVYMSGKVNFTGNLTYSGNTVLSNTVTSVSNSTNISSYTSKGTQEIIDASSSFPSTSTVINNGLDIFNRTTPLTVTSNIEGTEDVLQVGAAITLTGVNTHSGNTTIDLNKSLNIGSGETTGSITGNINNFGTLTFNRSDSSSYAGIISGSGALEKSGSNLFTLTGLNTYTGATTINDGSLILERDIPATSSSGFSGLGTLVIQPSSNSFISAVSYPITGFTVSSSIGGLTIGKPTNTAAITFANATTIAGPITAYGGTITANANLVTTNSSNAPILLQGNKVFQNQGVSVQTNGSNITYNVTNSPWTTESDQGISLGTANGTTASINAQGGNVSIASSFASTGVTNTGGNSDVAILVRNSEIKTSGSGTVTLNGNAYDNASTNGDFIWGSMLHTNGVIQTEHGAISITGTGGKINGNARGIIADNTALKVLSASGPITFTEVMPNGHSVANHSGTYFKPSATNAIQIGADGSLVTNSTSNVVFDVARITFDGTIASTVVNTSGTVTIQPTGNQFDNAVSLVGLSLSNTATGFTIGKPTNTSNVIFGSNTTIAGPISAYGGIITLDANLTTTNNGNISLYTDSPLGGLSTPRILTAAGAFKYIPRGTTFTADVTYPIANLTATSTGLTIGKTTNTKNITIAQDVSGGAGIELYGANVNINSNLKTTNSGLMYLKGNTTIAAGKYIESNGNFTHDGNMTFKSNAMGTAAFGTLGGTFTSVSGTSTVERYIPAKRAYRLLSSSVTTTSTIRQNWQENGGTTAGLGTHITGTSGTTGGFDATTTNNPSLFTINHSTGLWEAVTNTSSNTLSAGTAYRLMVRGDRLTDLTTNAPTATVTTLRATGVLKTGSHSPILNQASEGYSFVGNPYQAPVDIKAVLTASTNMNSGLVYYWDPTLNSRGAYVTRTLSSLSTNAPDSDFTEILQPGQAVFVKNAVTGIPSMTFNESNKSITNGAAGVFRVNTTTNDYGLLRVNLKANANNQWTTIEGALAVFNPMYSWEVNQEDANKLSNLDEEVSFMQNNTSLAIACQPNPSATNELPIRLNTTRRTNYQWQFELANYSGPTPYLFDTQNNTYTQIDNATIVSFTVNGQELTRFKIVFQNGTLSTPDFSSQVVLYPNPGASGATSFNIEGITGAEVSLYTLLGQKIPVKAATIGKGMEVISKTSLSKGVYLVGITKDGKTSHVKWIVE